MYHPLLSYAVAQARIDDLIRQGRHTSSPRHPLPPESHAFAPDEHRASLMRRLTRYAARRSGPSVA